MSKHYNSQPFKQDIHLLVLRSDYMIDVHSNALKLVEYNTIAASLATHCQSVRNIQTYIRQKYQEFLEFNYENEEDDDFSSENVKQMADVFYRTCELYKESMISKDPKYVSISPSAFWVLFVVDEGERNVCDQKWIEVELFQTHKVRSLRITLSQIAKRGSRDEKTGALLIDGYMEVAFVYYRTAYQVEQYANEGAWDARTLLECSRAIKCPSIDVHLTTFKKFQQAFSDEKLLHEVMGSANKLEAEALEHLFKGIWTLEYIESDPEVERVVALAIENPSRYVIKP